MDVRQVVLVLSATVLVLENIAMTQPIFDDERLDVDRLALEDSAVDDASNLGDDSDLTTIFSRLTRLIQPKTADASDAIEYEYRVAEYEYEENRMTESSRSDPPEPRCRAVLPELKKPICRPGQTLDDVRLLSRRASRLCPDDGPRDPLADANGYMLSRLRRC